MILVDWILKILDNNIKRFKTANPFELAEAHHIIIRYLPLGNTQGFYMKNARHQVITMNADLDEADRLYVCSHELGHAVLHPDENTPFMNQNTLRSKDKIEVQAHFWATQLLLRFKKVNLQKYETTKILCMENGIPYEMERFISTNNNSFFYLEKERTCL